MSSLVSAETCLLLGAPPPAAHMPLVTCPAAAIMQIYVLIRGKRGTTAKDRLAQLLQKGLFHLVRDNPRLLAKVSCCCCCPAATDSAAARAVVAAREVPQRNQQVHPTGRQTQNKRRMAPAC
jgi:hypothetical protein